MERRGLRAERSEDQEEQREEASQTGHVERSDFTPAVVAGWQRTGQASAEQTIGNESVTGTKRESKAPFFRTLQDSKKTSSLGERCTLSIETVIGRQRADGAGMRPRLRRVTSSLAERNHL